MCENISHRDHQWWEDAITSESLLKNPNADSCKVERWVQMWRTKEDHNLLLTKASTNCQPSCPFSQQESFWNLKSKFSQKCEKIGSLTGALGTINCTRLRLMHNIPPAFNGKRLCHNTFWCDIISQQILNSKSLQSFKQIFKPSCVYIVLQSQVKVDVKTFGRGFRKRFGINV